MKVLKEIKLINSDVDSNHNKYWNASLLEDGTIEVEYGRVGYFGNKETYDSSRGGEKFLNKKVKEKIRKGYQELKVIKTSVTSQSLQKNDLKEIVKEKVNVKNTELSKLIELLVETNVHNIISNTNISFDKNNNLFSTPLGIVTSDGIEEARKILNKIIAKIDTNDINQYLRLIPQSFGMRKFDINIFKDSQFVKKQYDILDSLEVSWNSIKSQPSKDYGKKVGDDILNIKLDILDKNSKEFKRISDKFEKTKKSEHRQSNFLSIHKIYEIEIKSMKDKFDTRKVSKNNVVELWHGTNVANILSIFNTGLKCSPPKTAHVTGVIWPGVYFASDSTKSLNYSVGFWSGQKQNHVFLFVADVDIGNPYTPKSSYESLPKSGYDSTWAKARISGIINDEYIVYNDNQCNLKYLIECS